MIRSLRYLIRWFLDLASPAARFIWRRLYRWLPSWVTLGKGTTSPGPGSADPRKRTKCGRWGTVYDPVDIGTPDGTAPHPPLDVVRVSLELPNLRILARRAFLELCFYYDIDTLPGWAFEVLSVSEGQVDIAFARLVKEVGLDSEAVRLGRAEERELLQSAIDCAVALDELRKDLDENAYRQLRQRLRNGGFATVEREARVVIGLRTLRRRLDIRAPRTLFACEAKLVEQVDELAHQVFSVDPEILRERVAAVASTIETLERIEEAALHFENISEAVVEQFPDDLVGTETELHLIGLLDQISGIIDTCRSVADISVDQLATAFHMITVLVDDLTDLHDDLFSDGSDTSGCGRSTSTVDDALAFFGIRSLADLTHDALKKAYRAFVKKNHPDLFTDPAEKMRQEELTQRANAFHDVLKEELN